MDENVNYKEVDFKKYCELCTFKNTEETEDPCDHCLETPARLYSKKPVKFKEKRK